MNISEFNKIMGAIIVMIIIWCVDKIIIGQSEFIPQIILFSVIIVVIAVFSKKAMAGLLDADVEHDTWKFQRFWFFPGAKLPKPIPAGIIFPLFVTFFTIGLVKFSALLTYETRAKTSRKAKRAGYYSFAQMTDWHNGVIGAAGIISILAVGWIAYFLPWNIEILAKMCSYYALCNILPISKLDGTQILFGSKTLWAILATITIILSAFALMI